MKSRFLPAGTRLISGLILLLIPFLLRADERILSYTCRIDILPDASVEIEETIRVRAEGNQIKRGIFRALPLKALDKTGKKVKTRFEILDIRSSAPGGGYFTERDGDYLMVYVGDQNIFLDPGEYTYVFKYKVLAQVGFFEKFDEIYWNVTGDRWGFPIDTVSAFVVLPSGSRPLSWSAYTGAYGEQGKDYSVDDGTEGMISFRTTRILTAGEGLTVSVSWPKGFVRQPPPSPGPVFGKFTYVILGVLGLMLTLAYYLWAWNRVGRDPEKGPIIPLFEPPDGLSPAALRYLWKNGFDDKAFTATLIGLAVKGFLLIEEQDDEYTLQLLKKEQKDLDRDERAILSELFKGTDFITLNRKNYKRPLAAKNVLQSSMNLSYEKGFFRHNYVWFIPGILITALTFATQLFPAWGDDENTFFFGIWLFGWSIGVMVLGYMTFMAWKWKEKKRWFLSFFILPFLAAELFVGFRFAIDFGWFALAVLFSLFSMNILFYYLLKAPTLAGSKILARIEGFRQYLTVAETERLAVLHPPKKTPQLFERFLPYAIALNAEKAWGEQFHEILAEAIERKEYVPTWYHGRMLMSSFHAASFSDSIGSSFNNSISDYSSAPSSSSGSGGGGFSGGGGGGGGGGGW